MLRICYVYSKSLFIRLILLSFLAATTIATFVVFFTNTRHVLDPRLLDLPSGTKNTGCKAPPSGQVWKLMLPNLIIHTVLYLATTVPALRMRRIGKKSRLMNRLVIE